MFTSVGDSFLSNMSELLLVKLLSIITANLTSLSVQNGSVFIMVTLFIAIGQFILYKNEVMFGPKQCPYQGLTTFPKLFIIFIISFQSLRRGNYMWQGYS